jgi:pilus assembly protein CpaB
LTPTQTETLALSQQLGTLSLALRSITDATKDAPKTDESPNNRRNGVNVVRFGVGTMTTPK